MAGGARSQLNAVFCRHEGARTDALFNQGQRPEGGMRSTSATVTVLILTSACIQRSFGPSGGGTDLSGTWPVNCAELTLSPGNHACTLSGLSFSIRQLDGSVDNDVFSAPLTGNYNSFTVACPGEPSQSRPAGTMSGRFSGHTVTLSLADRSAFNGDVVRPTTSLTLIELQLTASVPYDNQRTLSGSCKAGPIETRSR